MTALVAARTLVGETGRIALVDTEGGSASLYADVTPFDTIEMRPPFHPERFAAAIGVAADAGYDVIVLDGISPAWTGEGGVQAIVDAATTGGKNAYGSGWKVGNPAHNRLVGAILTSPIHLIATLRSKSEYVTEVVNGKTEMRKIGLGPVQRDGLDYEFTIFVGLDLEHVLTIEKSRCADLPPGTRIAPGLDAVAEATRVLAAWLAAGAAAPPAPPAPPAAAAAAPIDVPPAPVASPAATVQVGMVDRDLTRELALLAQARPDVDWPAMLDTKAAEVYGGLAFASLDDAQFAEFKTRLASTIDALTPKENA
jgi:hypothetical protein